MWKVILQPRKAILTLVATLFFTLVINSSYGQQYIIANKDNTRPETARQYDNAPARIPTFAAIKFNGYNEIQWTAVMEQDTRKFIVEYSYDGINFQSAGEVLSAKGEYNIKHYTLNSRSVLYCLRIEGLNGKFYYSDTIVLDGTEIPPVKIYPTVVTGNVLNANADFPVERIIIVSGTGQQMFAKDLNGASEFIRINIPSLNKGLYLITFYGNGWKSTAKFMVG